VVWREEYVIKGTIIALVGYYSFSVGAWVGLKTGFSRFPDSRNWSSAIQINPSIDPTIILFAWIVCFALSILFLALNGYSIQYILSGGFSGTIEPSNTLLLFLSKFSVSMLSCWLMYYAEGKSRALKIITFVLTIVIHWGFGYRYIIVADILSVFIFRLLNRKTQIKLIQIAILAGLLMIITGVVQTARVGVRSGANIIIDTSLHNSIDAIMFNLRIYFTYYAVIKAVPSLIPFNMGQQVFLYTLIMMIPRALWPGKPYPRVGLPVEYGLSHYASTAGQAYPNIGEFYFEYGVLGVIVFMFIFGRLIRVVVRTIKNNPCKKNYILYSIVYGLSLQVLIRGYTPSNFYMMVFALFPVLIIYNLAKKNRQLSGDNYESINHN